MNDVETGQSADACEFRCFARGCGRPLTGDAGAGQGAGGFGAGRTATGHCLERGIGLPGRLVIAHDQAGQGRDIFTALFAVANPGNPAEKHKYAARPDARNLSYGRWSGLGSDQHEDDRAEQLGPDYQRKAEAP